MSLRIWRRARQALLGGLALLGAFVSTQSAVARPLELQDVLNREAFGKIVMDPSQRWLVVERRGPYASGARFDLEQFTDIARTRLMVVDLAAPGPARTLIEPEPRTGYALGPFSPDGARMVVYRLTATGWNLGVVSLADRRTTWFPVTPDLAIYSSPVQWVSNREVVLLARATGEQPLELRWRRTSALELPARWAASASGEGSHTVVGSGRYIGLRPQGSTKEVVRLDVGLGAATTLATGDFLDLEPSPDGSRLALIEAGDDIALDASRSVQGDYGMGLRVRRLRILDLRTRTVTTPCATCDVLMSPLAWSAPGQQLLVYARRDGEPWPAGRLLRIDGHTGAVREVSGEIAPQLERRPEAVRASWLGQDPIVWGAPRSKAGPRGWYRLTQHGAIPLTADLAAPSREGVTVARRDLLLAAGGRAWRIEPDGRREALAAGVSPIADPREASEDRTWFTVPRGDALVALRHEGGAAFVSRLEDDGRVRSLPVPSGADLLAFANERDGAVVRYPGPGAVERLAWVSARGAEIALDTINTEMADLEGPLAREVSHRGPNGQLLKSWLVIPPATAIAPPLVVLPYLGASYPRPPSWLDLNSPGFRTTPALLVAHGYAVLIPSLPGLPREADPIAGLATRILGIVDAAQATPGLEGAFDVTRLAIWGQSYGAYSTLAVLTQTDRFKVAIAQSGPSDLFSMHGEFQPALRADPEDGLGVAYATGWVEDLQGGMGAPPWIDPQRWVRNSPAWAADRVSTPLMLLHGDQDTIPIGQAEQMFSELYRQNKDAVLVTYWGEGHVFRSPGNLKDLYARTLAWLDDHLGNRP